MDSNSDEQRQNIHEEQPREPQQALTVESTEAERIEEERIEDKIDRDLDDSFPASDPPGWTMGVRKRRPKG